MDSFDMIYVVYVSYFMECRIVFYDGMHGIFGIQGETEAEDLLMKDLFPVSWSRAEFEGMILHDRYLGLESLHHYPINFTKVQYDYQTRLRWVTAVHSGLKSTKGFKFELSINIEFLYYDKCF